MNDDENCNTGPMGPHSFSAAVAEIVDDDDAANDWRDRLAIIRAMKSGYRKASCKVRGMRDEIESLRDRLASASADCECYQRMATTSQEEVADAKEDLERMTKRAIELQDRNRALEDEVARLRAGT